MIASTLAPSVRARRPRPALRFDDPGFARTLDRLLAERRDAVLLSAHELDRMAVVKPNDLDAACDLWDEAQDDTGLAGTIGQPRTDRRGLDALIALLILRLMSTAQRYRAGEITIAAWQVGQLSAIKAVQLAAATAAYGGKSAMGAQALALTSHLIRQQYAYQQTFTADILDGRQRMNGRLDVRAAQYASAGRSTYENVRRLQETAKGMRYERNVCQSGDECSSCTQQQALGWVRIGTLSPIGSRQCQVNCRCQFQFSVANPHYQAA